MPDDHLVIRYVSPVSGNDTNDGSLSRPWATIDKANRFPEPINIVRLLPGQHAHAPNRANVLFASAGSYQSNPSIALATIIKPALRCRVANMRVQGVTLAGGLDFDAGSDNCQVGYSSVKDHIWFGGDQSRAAKNNIIRNIYADLAKFGGHCYGEDPNRGQIVPHPSGNKIMDSRIFVTRLAGEERVMCRFGGVDDMTLSNVYWTMFQKDPTNTNADDYASAKFLVCPRWRFKNGCIIEFDDIHPNRNGTGAFWMVRDESDDWLSTGTWWRTVRGKIWLSFNTSGGVYDDPSDTSARTCTCGGHRFEGDKFDIVGLSSQCGSRGQTYIGCSFPRPYDTKGAIVIAA